MPDYTDLDLDFINNPTTGDIVKKVGDDAIKRSIRNLVFTNYYDKPFQSHIGSNVWKLLFENATPFTAAMLQDAIEQTIVNFENRVTVNSVQVVEDLDNNGYNVTLTYTILNRQTTLTTGLFLERIR